MPTSNIKFCPPQQLLLSYVHNPDLLIRNGYNNKLSDPADPSLVPSTFVACDRCYQEFCPSKYYKNTPPGPKTVYDDCHYHPRKIRKINGRALYQCCYRGPRGRTCATALKHVLRRGALRPKIVHDISMWKFAPTQLHIVAIDAEMLYTKSGMDITRISGVDWNLNTVLDLIVIPDDCIVDYNTIYTGLSKDFINSCTPVKNSPELSDLIKPNSFISKQKLLNEALPLIIGPDTILLGHSLENDLNCLGAYTKHIIDTSILFPNMHGKHTKYSLRTLALMHLKENIQDKTNGHDSVQDALACMKLLHVYISKK